MGELIISKVLAESGRILRRTIFNVTKKQIGTERVPKGHQKSAKGKLKYIKQLDSRNGERNKREGGGALGFLEHLWRHLVDLESQFGRPLDLGGSIRWAFLDVLGATPKIEKQTFVNNYTAKVGEAKYIEKRQSDGPSCFCLASLLAAIGFRRAHPRGVYRFCFDSCAAEFGK